DIRRSVRGSQFAATEVSGKNGFRKLLFEFRARRALADNQNPVPTRTGPQAPTDFLYDIQTLLGHEAGHKSHDDVIVADAELLTPLQRASARMKPFGINTSRPIQQSVVDPVRSKYLHDRRRRDIHMPTGTVEPLQIFPQPTVCES